MGLGEGDLRRIESYDSGPMLIGAAESGLGIALPLTDSVHFYPGNANLERRGCAHTLRVSPGMQALGTKGPDPAPLPRLDR